MGEIDTYSPDFDAVIRSVEGRRHHAAPEDVEYQRHGPPPLKLPGFGSSGDKCGEHIPEASYFCPDCGAVEQKKHICNQYDCPQHAAFAVRRRCAGWKDQPGVVARLGALRGLLDAKRDRDQFYHHIVLSPPEDFRFQSSDPLEAGFDLAREVLDQLRLEGLVAYHPFRGVDEDHDHGDLGFWQQVLFSGRDWYDDARPELTLEPHFHLVVAGPGVDLSDTERLEAETGWVINRITRGEDTNVSIYDDESLAAVTSYVLSHTGVTTNEAGQRRLAARLKGPHVADVDVAPKWARRHRANVYEAAEDTLDISPPAMSCDNEVPVERVVDEEPLEQWLDEHPPRSSDRCDHGGSEGGLEDMTPGVNPVETTSDPPDEPDTEECDGRLRHISQADEILQDPAARARLEDVRTLEQAYVRYQKVQRAKAFDRPTVPEHEDPPP